MPFIDPTPTPPVGMVMPIYNQDPDLLFDAVLTMIEQTAFQEGRLRLLFILDGANESTTLALSITLRDLQLKIGKNARNLSIYSRSYNKGLAATVAEGYELLGTQWVGWVSSDNTHKPHMVDTLLDASSDDVVMVASSYEVWDMNTDKEVDWLLPPTSAEGWLSSFQHGRNTTAVDVLRVGGAMMACIFRRSVLEKVQPRPELDSAEDLDFTLRVALAYPGQLNFLPDKLMRWNSCTKHSISANAKPQTIKALTRIWHEHVLPNRDRHPFFGTFRIHYVRPSETERVEALSRVHPFPLGGKDVIALVVPDLEYGWWCQNFHTYPLFIHMLLTESA